MSVRVGYFDIETFPIEAYTWGLWNQNIGISQIKKPTIMASFAWKWRGEKKTQFFSVHHNTREEMIQKAWDLMNEAQIVVTWNGDKFDVKHFNREFVEAGLQPPSPYKSLDLLKTARRQFYFPSNKLDYVSQALGLKGKVSTGGFQLWLDCMAGDDRAWARMRTYNKQDVVLLEQLHDRLLPYIKGHPHMGLLNGSDEDSCQNCGSEDLERRGFAYTPLARFQQYRCRPCGSWSRGKRSIGTVDVRGVQ